MAKKVRLSERDLKGMSMDEIEILDRSKNYILPLSYREMMEEYRKVYKIPDYEDSSESLQEYQARVSAERRARIEKQKKKEKEREGKTIEEIAKSEENMDLFNYNRKFSPSNHKKQQEPEQKLQTPKETKVDPSNPLTWPKNIQPLK